MKKYIFMFVLIISFISITANAQLYGSTGFASNNNNTLNSNTEGIPVPSYGIIGVYGKGSNMGRLDVAELYQYPNQTFFAGDFPYNDSTHLYVLDYHWYELGVIDFKDFSYKIIGQSKPGLLEVWTGMTGAHNGLMYASAASDENCSSESVLYTINLTNGEASKIANIQNSICIIDIVSLPNGDMYGIDVGGDTFMKINPITGETEIIGSIGFDANYAQGMDYSEIDNTLYYAAWNVTDNAGELRTIDISTGDTQLIESLGGIQMEVIIFPNFIEKQHQFIPLMDK